MSLEAALGRIDQILQLRQQLLDPAATSSASGGAGLAPASGAPAPGTTGSVPAATDFATALASAQSAGALGPSLAPPSSQPFAATQALGTASPFASTQALGTASPFTATQALASASPLPAVGPVQPGQVPPNVQAMINAANSLVGQPYVWGGGHSGWGPQRGYDCSGFVSAVLHAGGYLTAPQDTQTLPSTPGIESGPGQYVTIYDRTDAGSSTDHVIINLNGQFYESGGERGPWGGGGGVQPIATPTPAYLSTFNLVLHPAGL